MKTVDTREYLTVLKELVQQGKEVSLKIAGNSMSPFLIHNRDTVYFKQPDRELKKGDIVFFQRKNGQYIMHRIYKVKSSGYYIVGDRQREIEGPVAREQIFAIVTKVIRKGKEIRPGDFWWEFFEHVWIHMIPMREAVIAFYGKLYKKRL